MYSHCDKLDDADRVCGDVTGPDGHVLEERHSVGGETARLPHKGNGVCYHRTTLFRQYLSLVSTANFSQKKIISTFVSCLLLY